MGLKERTRSGKRTQRCGFRQEIVMKRFRFAFLLTPAIALLLLLGGTYGQDSDSPEEAKTEIIQAKPIDSGYVILDGRYLPPPYILEQRGNDLWVNDQLASSGWFARFGRPMWGMGFAGRGDFGRRRWDGGGPGQRDGGGPGQRDGEKPDARNADRPGPDGPRGHGRPGAPHKSALASIERTLEKGGMLVASQEFRACKLSETDAALVVNALQSGDSQQEKLAQIRNTVPYQIEFDEAKWLLLIETFEPSTELMERISPEIERAMTMIEENQIKHEAALASQFWNSRPLKYVITLMAMGLVVAACGTLLNYRPQSRAAWSEIDANGDGIPLVVRSVVLLVLLGIFDLGCTLVAQQAGGFTEMNPLGSQIVENPALLTTFKLTTLLLACGILYALRRYRGAQVASWWMCLLCTVLTFRWLTYNSMFMS